MAKTPLEIGAIIGADMAKILKDSNNYTDAQIKTISDKIEKLSTSNTSSGPSFKIVNTLPAPSLETFQKIRYSLDTNLVYICISNTLTPTNDDCFWVEL